MAQINLPHSLTEGTTAFATQVMNNLNAIKNTINAGIQSDNIEDLAVTTTKIADLAVTAAKIANSNITTDKIADLAVTAAKIANDAVTDVKIGTRTIDDATVTAYTNTAKITDLLSLIVKTVKNLKGTTNWYDDGADTITNLNSRIISNDADITNLQNNKADISYVDTQDNTLQANITNLEGAGRTTETVKATYDDLQNHKGLNNNPHAVTASQVNAYSKTELLTSGQAQVHWENLTNVPAMADDSWKSPVATIADLPSTGNIDGDLRIVLDEDTVYTWDASTLAWIAIGASGNGITDHGSLKGLSDDDHTQYLRTDGTRALTGNQDFAQNQALNMVEHKGIAFPVTPVVGQRFFRTDLDHAFVYTSTGEWIKVSGYGSLLRREKFTASITGYEQFTLVDGQYELGKNALLVFVNGNIVDHTEDDTTHFTVTVTSGDTVLAWYLQNSPAVTIQADGTLQTNLNADMVDDKHFADIQVDAQARVDELAGTGRTTETVKQNADNHDAHLAETVIKTSKTINVPADYATIQEALDSLKYTWIPDDITVTISVAAGTHLHTSQISITHSCGSQIQIIGADPITTTITSVGTVTGAAGAWSVPINVTNATGMAVGDYVIIRNTAGTDDHYAHRGIWEITAINVNTVTVKNTHQSGIFPSATLSGGDFICLKTVLKFNNCNGIVSCHANLGLLDKVAVVGNGTSGYSGVVVGSSTTIPSNASIVCGSSMGVNGFGSRGFYALYSSSIEAPSSTASGNGSYGFCAEYSSSISTYSSTASGNGSYGFCDLYSSSIRADASTASGNGSYGFCADYSSSIRAYSSTASGNGSYGFCALYSSSLRADSSTASGNASSDYFASKMGYIYCYSYQGTPTFSPALNTEGNGNAIITT